MIKANTPNASDMQGRREAWRLGGTTCLLVKERPLPGGGASLGRLGVAWKVLILTPNSKIFETVVLGSRRGRGQFCLPPPPGDIWQHLETF